MGGSGYDLDNGSNLDKIQEEKEQHILYFIMGLAIGGLLGTITMKISMLVMS